MLNIITTMLHWENCISARPSLLFPTCPYEPVPSPPSQTLRLLHASLINLWGLRAVALRKPLELEGSLTDLLNQYVQFLSWYSICSPCIGLSVRVQCEGRSTNCSLYELNPKHCWFIISYLYASKESMCSETSTFPLRVCSELII